MAYPGNNHGNRTTDHTAIEMVPREPQQMLNNNNGHQLSRDVVPENGRISQLDPNHSAHTNNGQQLRRDVVLENGRISQLDPNHTDRTNNLLQVYAVTHGTMFTAVTGVFSTNRGLGSGMRRPLNLLSVLVSSSITLALLLIFYGQLRDMRRKGRVRKMWLVERGAIIIMLMAISAGLFFYYNWLLSPTPH